MPGIIIAFWKYMLLIYFGYILYDLFRLSKKLKEEKIRLKRSQQNKKQIPLEGALIKKEDSYV
jgi:hypothetical protein